MSTTVTTVSYKKTGDKQLTKNFKLSELRCKDGSDTVKYCMATLEIAQKLRDKFGSLTVSSAYRTESHNKSVGGSSSSQHVKGRAMDLIPNDKSVSLEEMAKYAESLGATGIIWYKTKKFIHIDTRDKKYFAINVNGKATSVITFGGKPLSNGTMSDGTIEATSNNKTKMKEVQKWLNTKYNLGLKVDGLAGPLTKKALIKALQKYLGVKVDGSYGSATSTAMSKHNVKLNDKGDLVYIIQGMLYANGYNPNGFDGKFGSGCEKAVKTFQKAKGLTQDGKVGAKTMAVLVK